jgi:hypothetical protein
LQCLAHIIASNNYCIVAAGLAYTKEASIAARLTQHTTFDVVDGLRYLGQITVHPDQGRGIVGYTLNAEIHNLILATRKLSKALIVEAFDNAKAAGNFPTI